MVREKKIHSSPSGESQGIVIIMSQGKLLFVPSIII